MYDIITVGSATVDAFVKTPAELIHHEKHLDLAYLLGGKILIEDLKFSTGGGATNTAVAFSRLGLKTACVSAIGRDANGQMILHELKKEKVDFLGNIKDGETGYSIILPGANDRTILHYKGLNNSLSLEDVNLGLFKTHWLYVSTMLEESYETTKKLVEKAKKQDAKIVLNISMYLAKQGISHLYPILHKTDIIILNKEEILVLTKHSNVPDAIKSLSKYTKAIIVVTDSVRPIHVFDWKKNQTFRIKKVRAVDTTGAGDAFAAGFVYGIMKRKSIKEAINFGYKESCSVLKAIGAKNNLLKKL